MADHKPPRLDGDERQTVLALLQYQRESFVRKVMGVDEAAARTALVDSGTTLLWLVKHMAGAESLWIERRFAGREIELSDDTVDPVDTADTVVAAVDAYRRTWRRVDDIVAAASFDETCRDTGDEAPVNLRWVLMHLLEETARHAGHADILRELVDGHTGR
jgi:hypothetical protein